MKSYETYIPKWDDKDDWYDDGVEYSSPEVVAEISVEDDIEGFDDVVFVREKGKPETVRKFQVTIARTVTVEPVE